MTNAVPVFRELLEDFKLGLDPSLLAGVLHPVLHGFNYSPPRGGLPRLGALRLLLQRAEPLVAALPAHRLRGAPHDRARQSEFQADIAILGPRPDEWTRDGLLYQPFPEVAAPWYHYHLWQAFQQAGFGTDFVSEAVLRGARVRPGRLRYGQRTTMRSL